MILLLWYFEWVSFMQAEQFYVSRTTSCWDRPGPYFSKIKICLVKMFYAGNYFTTDRFKAVVMMLFLPFTVPAKGSFSRCILLSVLLFLVSNLNTLLEEGIAGLFAFCFLVGSLCVSSWASALPLCTRSWLKSATVAGFIGLFICCYDKRPINPMCFSGYWPWSRIYNMEAPRRRQVLNTYTAV